MSERVIPTLVLCVTLCVAPARLAAQTRDSPAQAGSQADRARKLADRGFDLYQEGRYEEANAFFREAQHTFHAPTIMVMIARSYAKLERLADAETVYRQIIALRLGDDAPGEFRTAQQQAREELAAIEPDVPQLDLRVSDPSSVPRVRLTIDGEPIASGRLGAPVPVNPGTHSIVVEAPGATRMVRQIAFAKGRVERVDFIVPSPRSDRPSRAPRKPEGERQPALLASSIAAFGVGAAGLAMGTITGVIALDKQAELEKRCPTKQCRPQDEDLADAARRNATLSTVGFVVGGVGVAAGVTLLLVWQGSERPPASERATLRLWIGPASASLSGVF